MLIPCFKCLSGSPEPVKYNASQYAHWAQKTQPLASVPLLHPLSSSIPQDPTL